MMTTTAIQSVGNLGIFPSRAFLPAFLTALVMRVGPDVPIIQRSQFLSEIAVTSGPSWFTHDFMLIALGVLAVLEYLAMNNVDVRQLMNEMDAYIKSGVAALTTLGVITAQEVNLLGAVTGENLANLPMVAASAGGVFAAARLRASALEPIDEATGDDGLVSTVLNWLETSWVLLAVILMVVLPSVLFILTALLLGSFVLVRFAWKRREAMTMVACGNCGDKMHCSALKCPACKHDNARPCTIGFFGQSQPEHLANPDVQPYRLVEKKRCPVCATHLEGRHPRLKCDTCGHETLSEAGFADEYDRYIASRKPQVLVVCLLCSFIPVVGAIPGIIYYHSVLVSPYRRYLPFWRRLFSRLLLKVVLFLLLALQWIPLLGMLSIPLMALLSYRFASRSWRKIVAASATTHASPSQQSAM